MHLPPSLANSTAAADNVGAPTTCTDINHCRKPSHIVWSCLATIFIYTYVSLHLNVPGPRQGLWKRCKRIVKMMLFALVAPELFVGFAFRQFGCKEGGTRTEGFFFAMGGFVGVHGHPIVLLSEFRRHEYPDVEVYPEPQPELSERERMVENIKDKSTKNLLAKAFAFLQGAWFILQCAFRLKQRLPLTQLEVMTAAYGVVNIFIWALWWYKPIGVDQLIRLALRRVEDPGDGDKDESEEEYRLHDDNNEHRKKGPVNFGIFGSLLGFYVSYNPTFDRSIPDFWSSDSTRDDSMAGLLIECLVGFLFGCIHVAAWNSDFRTSVELWIWRGSAVAVTGVPLLLATTSVADGWLSSARLGLSRKAVVKQSCGIIFRCMSTWTFYPPLVFTYVTARLLLVGVVFAALRALPEPVLEDVMWSSWFPHIT
ncbi:hypothetical protein C8F01DRAFT_981052 [Mycena amicta]|nr:hypothetical protein C8F01DRAFT_981052 [Mycena amicta]